MSRYRYSLTRGHGTHCSPEKPVPINEHIGAKLRIYHWLGEEKTQYLLFENRMVLIWIALSPLHTRMLYASLLNLVKVFLLFLYLPWEKGMTLHLNKTQVPFIQRCFVPSLVEIGPVVLEKKILKIWKVYDDDNDYDNANGQLTNFHSRRGK